MAIKVMFPPDKESITVTGLYQWDYGQQLEIEDESLPEHIDVHFSCTSMTEAIVRDCCRNEETGIHTVFIPDDCLEQASPITAWIYDWSVTSGKTVKVINLPVIARARPSLARGVSSDEDDHFATLVTELNAAVDGLKNGTIKVKSAETADNVNGFTGEVESAKFATQAGSAQKDHLGNIIHNTYFAKENKPLVLPKAYTNRTVRLYNHRFNYQEDLRLLLTNLSKKKLDDIVAFGFSFVYTDGNMKDHLLEAHGVKTVSPSKETAAPSVDGATSITIACNVVPSGANFDSGLGADTFSCFGSITVELTRYTDGSVTIRFVGSNIHAGENLPYIDFVSWSQNCVLKETYLYVI